MEYDTFIFEKSDNKVSADIMDTFGIFAFIGLCIIFYLIGIPGIGLGAIVLIGISLFKLKMDSDVKKGINRFGSLKATITISTEYLKIRDVKIPLEQLQDLVIYVDEYSGMSKSIIGNHHGGNNEITFRHQEKEVSINYLIKSKKDFEFVEALVEQIEDQTNANNS